MAILLFLVQSMKEARKYFFFEKKKQKTFVHLADTTEPQAHVN